MCHLKASRSATAALLRNPECVLRKLFIMDLDCPHFDDEGWRSFGQQASRVLSAFLVGNTHLKCLSLFNRKKLCNPNGSGNFDKLLCDIASIMGISNSNHTLERIDFFRKTTSTFTKECVKLNQNANKARVIRDKILHIYFVGEFDVSPFFQIWQYRFCQK